MMAAIPAAAPAATETEIATLMSMGFERAQVTKALQAAFNDLDRAAEYLLTGIPEEAPEATGAGGGHGTPATTGHPDV